MSYPAKIEVALTVLNYCRGVEVGPVPQNPGLEWKPDMGRTLTLHEREVKSDAINCIQNYLKNPDVGPLMSSQSPIAVMLAQMAGNDGEDPPAEPPGPTVEKPQPPPTAPGDDANKPNEPKPEEKKPAEPAPTEKAKA